MANNPSTKILKINAEVNTSSIDKAKKQIEEFTNKMGNSTSDIFKKSFGNTFKEEFLNSFKSERLSDFERKYEDLNKHSSEYRRLLSEAQGKWIAKDLVENLTSLGKTVISKVGETIVDFAKNLFSESLELATWDIRNSLIVNTEAREVALKYGLTGSQAYGFSKAKEALGITSEEDFFYLNENQMNYFKERMEHYSEQYDTQIEFAKEAQKYQIEMNDLKEDIKMEVIKWFVDNRDIIKDFAAISLNVMKGILSVVSSIANLLGLSPSYAENYKAGITKEIGQKLTNVKIDNSYTINGGDKAQIEQSVTSGYAPLIKALKGGNI